MTNILTAHEAARHLKCSYVYLAKLRQCGTGPIYSKAGSFIKYKETDLNDWLDARVIKPSGLPPQRSSRRRRRRT